MIAAVITVFCQHSTSTVLKISTSVRQELICSGRIICTLVNESVTLAIIQKWLVCYVPTRTHQHLIEYLKQSLLGARAELIAKYHI